MSESTYISIILKSDWTSRIKTNRIYSLEYENRTFIDIIFDKLHEKNKMEWSKKPTLFDYFVFVIWKTSHKNDKSIEKKRVIIDIRDLNEIIVNDAYSMSTQTDVIVAVVGCEFISMIDATGYFHQWTVKYDDRHKQTVISHRDQKQFNVIVMKFKNSLAYVQRQIDLMLKDLRDFVKTFIDDIIIFSRIRKSHLNHLKIVFNRLFQYEMIFNFKKTFLVFFSLIFLNQIVDVLNMTIAKEKLAIISKLKFSTTLKNLKVYLNFTEWLKIYVSFYVHIAEPLQRRKTFLFKNGPKKKFKKNRSQNEHHWKMPRIKNTMSINNCKTYLIIRVFWFILIQTDLFT